MRGGVYGCGGVLMCVEECRGVWRSVGMRGGV